MTRLLWLCIVTLSCAAVPWAGAQPYPARPVRFIVPWTSGSGTDLMSRMLAQKLSETLKQQVVVENRGGAGAIIGTQAAAKSPADGYTIYVGGSVSLAVSPLLYKQVGYDPLRDFAPVSLVSKFFNALAVHPSLPARSVAELIAFSKARPAEILMASAGNGSTSHLAGELFMNVAKVKWTHVPYKGGGQAVTGVLSGEAHLMIAPISTVAPHAKTGKLRLLGVTSRSRIASLPDVPTLSESRLPGFEYGGWQGILVPAGTSPDIIARLHSAILTAIDTREFRDYLQKEGSERVGSTPREFAGFIRQQVAKHAHIIGTAGIKIQ